MCGTKAGNNKHVVYLMTTIVTMPKVNINPYKRDGNKENTATMGITSQSRVPSTKKSKQNARPKRKMDSKASKYDSKDVLKGSLILKGQTMLTGKPIRPGVDNGQLTCKKCLKTAQGYTWDQYKKPQGYLESS